MRASLGATKQGLCKFRGKRSSFYLGVEGGAASMASRGRATIADRAAFTRDRACARHACLPRLPYCHSVPHLSPQGDVRPYPCLHEALRLSQRRS